MRVDRFPGPFEWTAIPGGTVTLEPGGYVAQPTTFEVGPFLIARYPVTNQQYAAFMAAGGYDERECWTADGWAAKERHKWTEPRRWLDAAERYGTCPVIGVSWHEAVAYCRWLAAITGSVISLPTEQQWQRAAQGDDGREFPWGSEWPDETRCNWNRDVDRTTPVSAYPDGASPFGVMDMSGNAWEWCRTGWESGTTVLTGGERRIVRGGCWVNDSPLTLQVTRRDGPFPIDGYSLIGFRLARDA